MGLQQKLRQYGDPRNKTEVKLGGVLLCGMTVFGFKENTFYKIVKIVDGDIVYFEGHEHFGISSYLIEDYFLTDKKYLRKRKLEKINENN